MMEYTWNVAKGDDLIPLRNHEPTVLEFLKKVSGRNKVLVDVGAHIGWYSVVLSKYYGKIIAIEPNPNNYQLLLKNLKDNKIENVTTINVAVGERRGKVFITNEGAHSTVYKHNVGNCIEVEVKPLDDLIEHADVIKIDVEGYELNVIDGAIKLIRRCKPILVIEHHGYWVDDYDIDHEIILDILRPYYYALNINQYHWAYIPREMDLGEFGEYVANHWFYSVVVKNLRSGLEWYHGLPYEWWHGKSILEWYNELKRRIKYEDEWFKIF